MLAEGRTLCITFVFRKECLLQAAGHPERTASQKQARPRGLHLVPPTSSGNLAQSFLSLSLSFPIWKVIIPDLAALLGSCEFNDIRAHECGTTLKSCKGTGGKKKKKGKGVFAPHLVSILSQAFCFGRAASPQRRLLSSRFRPQGPQWWEEFLDDENSQDLAPYPSQSLSTQETLFNPQATLLEQKDRQSYSIS